MYSALFIFVYVHSRIICMDMIFMLGDGQSWWLWYKYSTLPRFWQVEPLGRPNILVRWPEYTPHPPLSSLGIFPMCPIYQSDGQSMPFISPSFPSTRKADGTRGHKIQVSRGWTSNSGMCVSNCYPHCWTIFAGGNFDLYWIKPAGTTNYFLGKKNIGAIKTVRTLLVNKVGQAPALTLTLCHTCLLCC